jgi:hypothetical protein
MPALPRLHEFDRQLALVVRPALEALGYLAGAHRGFRRIQQGEHGTLVHIVHFQVGIKSMTGKFTANLVVYHSTFCPNPGAASPETATFGNGFMAQWIRAGGLQPVRPSTIDKLLRRTPAPEDRWWPQSEDPAKTAASLHEVLAIILEHAPAWFAIHGTEDACRQEFERVQARRSATIKSDA